MVVVVQGAHKGRPYIMSFFVGATLVVALCRLIFCSRDRDASTYLTVTDIFTDGWMLQRIR